MVAVHLKGFDSFHLNALMLAACASCRQSVGMLEGTYE